MALNFYIHEQVHIHRKTSFSHDNPTQGNTIDIKEYYNCQLYNFQIDTVHCHIVTEIPQCENLAYQYSPTVELEMRKCAAYGMITIVICNL